MRVTFVSEEWQRNGGAGAYLRRLAAALAARGDAVQVVHADRAGVPLPGVTDVCLDQLVAFASSPARHAATSAALEAVAAFRPDVVHVHRCFNVDLEAALRARYRTTKTLHVYDFCPTNTKYHHALDRECAHPTGALCLPRMAYKRCTTSRRPQVWLGMQRQVRVVNRSNAEYARLIVASAHVARQAVASGYPADQVAVVPYFVDVTAEAPPSGERLILTAGRLVREKGFDLFIDALAHVPAPWRAIIAGDGMERERLESRARDARLGGSIEFVGWQSADAMEAWHRRAAVVVMPSRWPEPSGIVGLEAMAHGRPAVAFAVGGIPEWLDHGVTGLLAPPLDAAALGGAIGTLLADPAAALRMGNQARARAAALFSSSRHLALLDQVYASLPAPRT